MSFTTVSPNPGTMGRKRQNEQEGNWEREKKVKRQEEMNEK